MIKISMTSSDVNRQIEALKALPKIATRHYRPALSKITKQLKGQILPNIPVATGRARAGFGSKVTGSTITSLKGAVGWYDKNDPWYPNILEHGAKSHLMAGSTRDRKKQKAFESALEKGESFGGAHVFIRGAGWRTIKVHPGFSAMGFMAAGYSALKPIIDHELQLANEAVVKELAT